MMAVTLKVLMAALGVSVTYACSHFTMNNDYLITARTEDLPGAPIFTLFNKPRDAPGLRTSKYGYVAFMDSNIRSGMNEKGLMCDKQTLHVATYPSSSRTRDNIDAAKICQWALEGYGSVSELKAGLRAVNFVRSQDPAFALGHWAFRDAEGKGIVMEFTNHTMKVYDDNNDHGKTGYGVMTNDPPFPEHLREIAQLNASATNPYMNNMPYGSWSSEDRFIRIHLLKSSLPAPQNSEEAIMQAMHVVNSVSVPGGSWFNGAQTQWSAVWDHVNLVLYWRAHTNQNVQRLRLADAGITPLSVEKRLLVNTSRLDWFEDAAKVFNGN